MKSREITEGILGSASAWAKDKALDLILPSYLKKRKTDPWDVARKTSQNAELSKFGLQSAGLLAKPSENPSDKSPEPKDDVSSESMLDNYTVIRVPTKHSTSGHHVVISVGGHFFNEEGVQITNENSISKLDDLMNSKKFTKQHRMNEMIMRTIVLKNKHLFADELKAKQSQHRRKQQTQK